MEIDKARTKAEMDCGNDICKNFTYAQGRPAAISNNEHDRRCIYPSMSFTAGKESTCTGECTEQGGPQPIAPKRCFAIVADNVAKDQDVCHKFSKGGNWIETRK